MNACKNCGDKNAEIPASSEYYCSIECRHGYATAAYVRVSSRSQNLASQRSAIEAAAEARGERIHHWYQEKQSGAKLDRYQLTLLREAARRGEVRRLYVFRLDRLSRSGIRDTLQVLEELKSSRCKVVSVADGFDLEGPAAEAIVAVMAWAASMERLALGERIAAARKRIEAKGGAWGRPRRVTTAQRKQIIALRAKKKTLRQIAVAVKVPKSTVFTELLLLASRKPTPGTARTRSKKAGKKKR